jgi:hypothetical protein
MYLRTRGGWRGFSYSGRSLPLGLPGMVLPFPGAGKDGEREVRRVRPAREVS